jgi:hypothetical protein
MAAKDVQILGIEVGDAPVSYVLPDALEFIPKAVTATFDGTNASGDFLPTLEIVSDSGHVVSRVPVGSAVVAGGSAEVTWAPFLEAAATAGVSVVPVTGSVSGLTTNPTTIAPASSYTVVFFRRGSPEGFYTFGGSSGAWTGIDPPQDGKTAYTLLLGSSTLKRTDHSAPNPAMVRAYVNPIYAGVPDPTATTSLIQGSTSLISASCVTFDSSGFAPQEWQLTIYNLDPANSYDVISASIFASRMDWF